MPKQNPSNFFSKVINLFTSCFSSPQKEDDTSTPTGSFRGSFHEMPDQTMRPNQFRIVNRDIRDFKGLREAVEELNGIPMARDREAMLQAAYVEHVKKGGNAANFDLSIQVIPEKHRIGQGPQSITNIKSGVALQIEAVKETAMTLS